MKKPIKAEMVVKQSKVGVMRIGDDEYISLTDLASFKTERANARFVITNWMSTYFTIDYLAIWEELNNPNFNRMGFQTVRNDKGRLFVTPSIWVKETNAKGIISKSGRYDGGTFAHQDIAFEFASWISPEIKLYLIKEFSRLKKDESYRNKLDWSAKRELAKTNYVIHTDAIKQNLVPILTEKQKKFVYADEADVLNVALFGHTAKEWREANPELSGNMRDYADILHLVVLINLENLNAEMIHEGISQRERLEKLNSVAKRQLNLLSDNRHIKRLDAGSKNAKSN
ncbi:hypothetical protein FACS189431_1680 [Alphaproteobacteria bacterium]|nr:hypothetical protein FACS189431_1680 [Alphaproteobacteria bacterium]